MTDERPKHWAEPNPDGKWRLAWGIHNGTLMGRDMGDAVTGLDSLEACHAEARRLDRQFRRTFRLWFATAYSPEGEPFPFPDLSHPYER